MEQKTKPRKSLAYPKTLSQCIEPLTRPILKTQGLAGTKIISEWPKIVGNKLADRCIPQKLSFSAGKKSDGTLSVAVENGFALELQHMQPVMIERLAVYFGYKAVSRIVISHTYVPEVKKETGKANKFSLSTECIRIAEEVEDLELREAFARMARTLTGSG